MKAAASLAAETWIMPRVARVDRARELRALLAASARLLIQSVEAAAAPGFKPELAVCLRFDASADGEERWTGQRALGFGATAQSVRAVFEADAWRRSVLAFLRPVADEYLRGIGLCVAGFDVHHLRDGKGGSRRELVARLRSVPDYAPTPMEIAAIRNASHRLATAAFAKLSRTRGKAEAGSVTVFGFDLGMTPGYWTGRSFVGGVRRADVEGLRRSGEVREAFEQELRGLVDAAFSDDGLQLGGLWYVPERPESGRYTAKLKRGR